MAFRIRNLVGYAVAVIAAGTLAVAGSMTVLADVPTCTEGQTPAADGCQLPEGTDPGAGDAGSGGDAGTGAGAGDGGGTTESEGGAPDPGAGTGDGAGSDGSGDSAGDGSTGGGDAGTGGDGATTDPGDGTTDSGDGASTDTGTSGDTGTTGDDGGDTGTTTTGDGGDTGAGGGDGGDTGGTTTDHGTTTGHKPHHHGHKPHHHRHHKHHAAHHPSRSQQSAQRSLTLHNHAFVPPSMDARLFREHYTPEGQIPEATQLPEATATTFLDATTAAGGSWALVAAVSWHESRWGTDAGAPLAGARLTAVQWQQYGTDGDGDGAVTHTNQADELATLAKLLDDQQPFDKVTNPHPSEAPLAAYLGDTDTAEHVALLADYYDAMGVKALEKGLNDPDVREALGQRVLDDKRVTVYDGGRHDIEDQLIDPRVLVTIEFLANRFGTVSVTCLISGHSVFTASGNVSLHSFGQAADIGSVGGEVINASEQAAPDSNTVKALKDVLRLPKSMQPYELISLWSLGGPSFALPDHDDHIHVGFKTVPVTTPAP